MSNFDTSAMTEKSTRELFFPDLYFQSGGRRIDYIICYSTRQVLSTTKGRDSFANFLDYLVSRGVHMEHTKYTKNSDTCFIKIHVPHEALEGLADATNIDLHFKTPSLPMAHKLNVSKCRRNALSYNDEFSPVYHRAKETIGRSHPKRMTQAERILITYNMLQEVQFGDQKNDKGLRRLQNRGVVKDSFALHEGPPRLTPTGPLTDRQLLAAYWGDIGNFTKEQPVDIIEKYFGPELAFYFAFVSFCNHMLLIASICGILFFVLGYVIEWKDFVEIRKDICQSEEYLCATCDPDICKLKPLKSFCGQFTESHVYDNIGTFFLGIFMSVWGTVFFELWDRRRNIYLIKWKLTHVEYDVSMRIGYEERADVLLLSPITGEMEPAMSKTSITWRYMVIVVIMLGLMSLVVFFVALSTMIKSALTKYILKFIHVKIITHHLKFLVNCLGALIQVFFIMIVDRVKKPSVRFMTDLENCRTQLEYDNSFIMKLWVLSFVNGYTALFYYSFVKGCFYTNPGDHSIYADHNCFSNDLCGAAGCNGDLIILLTFILVVKTLLVKCIMKVFLPITKYLFRKRKAVAPKRIVQWESDYLLEKLTDLSILNEYCEIIGRLTTVIFFTAIFPFVPLITFFCNYVEERVDANAYSSSKRRPIPRKVTGLGVWYYVLHFIILVGVLINALTSILTKDYLLTVYHKHYYGSLEDYIATRFSKFAINDYKTEAIKQQVQNLTYCVYNRPYRYPPEHPKKYQESPDRYAIIAFGACFVVVYQHVVFIITRIISKLIPNVSNDVKEHLHHQTTQEKKLIQKHRNQEYLHRRMSKTSEKNMRKVRIEDDQTT